MGRQTSKKLGKRKANSDEGNSRPKKKIKDVDCSDGDESDESREDASDESGDSEDDDEDDEEDDEPITMFNMAARSRQLDALALAEAERDADLLDTAVEVVDDDDEDDGDEMVTDGEAEGVTAVQRRMQKCIRVLAKFNQRAEKGR